jgi:hypothetical protein
MEWQRSFLRRQARYAIEDHPGTTNGPFFASHRQDVGDPFLLDVAPQATFVTGESRGNVLMASAGVFFDVLQKQQRQLELLADAVRLQAAMRRQLQQPQAAPLQTGGLQFVPSPPPLAPAAPRPSLVPSPPVDARNNAGSNNNNNNHETSSARRRRTSSLADMFAEAPVRPYRGERYVPASYHVVPTRKRSAPRKRIESGGTPRQAAAATPPLKQTVLPSIKLRGRLLLGGARKPHPQSLALPAPLLEVDESQPLSQKERMERLRRRWRTEQQYRITAGTLPPSITESHHDQGAAVNNPNEAPELRRSPHVPDRQPSPRASPPLSMLLQSHDAPRLLGEEKLRSPDGNVTETWVRNAALPSSSLLVPAATAANPEQRAVKSVSPHTPTRGVGVVVSSFIGGRATLPTQLPSPFASSTSRDRAKGVGRGQNAAAAVVADGAHLPAGNAQMSRASRKVQAEELFLARLTMEEGQTDVSASHVSPALQTPPRKKGRKKMMILGPSPR